MAEQRDAEDVLDLDRFACPAGPPVAGAQWDELRGVWERWVDAVRHGAHSR